MIKGPPPKTLQRSERPDINEPLCTLKCTVGATLKSALEKRMAKLAVQHEKTDSQLSMCVLSGDIYYEFYLRRYSYIAGLFILLELTSFLV